MLPSNFIRSFHGVLSNAGLEQSGVHILRHTFASMLFRNGIDVKIVSKLLGHSSVKITYDIYVHLFEEDISHITDVLDKKQKITNKRGTAHKTVPCLLYMKRSYLICTCFFIPKFSSSLR